MHVDGFDWEKKCNIIVFKNETVSRWYESYCELKLLAQVLLLGWTEGLLPENPGYDMLEIFAGKQAVTRAWCSPETFSKIKIAKWKIYSIPIMLQWGIQPDTGRLLLTVTLTRKPWIFLGRLASCNLSSTEYAHSCVLHSHLSGSCVHIIMYQCIICSIKSLSKAMPVGGADGYEPRQHGDAGPWLLIMGHSSSWYFATKLHQLLW